MKIWTFYASLEILDFSVPVWAILLIFIVFAVIFLSLYVSIFIKSRSKYLKDKNQSEKISEKDLYKFEDLQLEFEKEILKIKKLEKTKNKK
ncbi:TIGR04561 family membrane protein [Spiroplasma endosymbiont of Panorpa germanica]|uniref:TIGR04561 family membrane protein n=1 Tax=Spiroplasma endosymbiont of Panorpa germanica TaxID=3066314 RepID=UPI0030CF6FBF